MKSLVTLLLVLLTSDFAPLPALCAEQSEPYDFNIHLPPYRDLRARRISRVEQEFARQKRGLLPGQSSRSNITSRNERRAVTTLPTPGQPTHIISDDLLGGFEIVGDSGVSAQQLFLGTENLVCLTSLPTLYFIPYTAIHPIPRMILAERVDEWIGG
jgi:hypothetical protein